MDFYTYVYMGLVLKFEKVIDKFKAMNTEGERSLLLKVYKLCAMTNLYLKINFYY